ncbi:GIY-YIG nuclease family protein [Proteus sp. GOKU]|uniref:GIY-YIG nuclease family protein n=1 Tax=Proteus TaxID=583 RepID=UPI0018928F91|nr:MULTISPECIES: GIY-YIG nuclease family protein [Proteus]QPB79524.1 GIY-YIG nuclease family protein [Proteus sp. GOKU]QQP25531.1 GIY-YIG nuclease family protein [Proteus vulgaris]
MNEVIRKELKQNYKDSPSTAGIYLIRNKLNKMSLIASAQNAQGVLNRHLFELKFGQHRNKALQAQWNEQGESAFEFLLITHVKPDEKNIKLALETLLDKYTLEYEITDENSY